MSRALVAIGISKAPPLDELDGAVTDANEVADWATAAGYDHVHKFTDETGAVTARPIVDHCSNLLAIAELEQLVIFFAGHGYSPLPGHEVWLLSNWNADSNEAINASTSVLVAQGFERPQISFIADACRVTWNDAQGTTGQVILPKANPRASNSQVDQFYATKFGDVSQQYQPAQVLASYGIFSKELVAALKGAAAVDRQPRRVVTSRSLQDHLRQAVPKACARIVNAAIQHPDTNPQWLEPKDVYTEVAGPVPGDRGPIPRRAVAEDTATTAAVANAIAQRDQSIEQDARRYGATEGRQSYETGTGITVVGAEVEEVVTSANYGEQFKENNAWQIRVSSEEKRDMLPTDPCTALIRISTPRFSQYWITIPVYPKLIATALIDENGFSSLNYRPAWRFREPGAEAVSQKVEAALAEATAMFRHGVMPSRGRVREMISILRDGKFDNPALAIVAAYICQRHGDFDQIEDMQHYPIGRGPYTPYDLLLLSGREQPAEFRTVVGSFPSMSPGWGILPASELPFDQRLLKVIGGLVPSLWTMANPAAGAILLDVVSARRPMLAR